MGFFGSIGKAIKSVGHSLVHPSWGGPAKSIAESFGGGQKKQSPADPNVPSPANQTGWGNTVGSVGAAGLEQPIGGAPDIPGLGNLSPTRPPEAGGVPANGFDANGVWQQGPGQTIQGGEVPGGNLVNPAWQGQPQNQFAPIPPAPGYVTPVGTASQSSAYAAPTAADAATNYTNPGWLSGGKYGRRGPGTPRTR